MLFMVLNVFPLNPGHRKTYKKTQRSQTSVKGLRNEVHHCESLKLAAILDAILDFEKCSRVSSIHQADFVYVMSAAAESSEKITISVRSGYAHLAAWLYRQIPWNLEAARDWVLQWSHRSEIWEASRHCCCRDASQISERLESLKRNLAASRFHEILRRPLCL